MGVVLTAGGSSEKAAEATRRLTGNRLSMLLRHGRVIVSDDLPRYSPTTTKMELSQSGNEVFSSITGRLQLSVTDRQQTESNLKLIEV